MNPAHLHPDLACVFVPPANINFARVKNLERILKAGARQCFKGRQGRTFYFQFGSTSERDTFLTDLERMIARHGNQTQRITK